MRSQSARLQALLEPAVSGLGYELLGVEYLPQGKHSLLRLYIDSPEGITVDDCGRVSHQVSGILDVEEPIHGEYTLEVSSPGLDRPLFTVQQVAERKGQIIKLRLNSPVDDRRKFKGEVLSAENDIILLRQDDETYEIPWSYVDKINLVPEFE